MASKVQANKQNVGCLFFASPIQNKKPPHHKLLTGKLIYLSNAHEKISKEKASPMDAFLL
jgi:hypothetical protein